MLVDKEPHLFMRRLMKLGGANSKISEFELLSCM